VKSNIALSFKIYVWVFLYCCFIHSVGFALSAMVLSIILSVIPIFTSKVLMVPAICIVGWSFFCGDRSFAEWVIGFMPFIWIAFADSVFKMFD